MPDRRSIGTLAFVVAALRTAAPAGGVTFDAQYRFIELTSIPESNCHMLASSTAPGLFAAAFPPGCQGSANTEQSTVIVPSTFIGGYGDAAHDGGLIVTSARSFLTCAFTVEGVATLDVGGQLLANDQPEAFSRVRIVDGRGRDVFLAEATSGGSGDLFVVYGATLVLPADQYVLRVEAFGAASDFSTFASFTFAGAFTPGNLVCPADLNGDGVVDGDDLGLLLAAWRGSDPGCDVTGDGIVDAIDLDELMAMWGSCERRADADGAP